MNGNKVSQKYKCDKKYKCDPKFSQELSAKTKLKDGSMDKDN